MGRRASGIALETRQAGVRRAARAVIALTHRRRSIAHMRNAAFLVLLVSMASAPAWGESPRPVQAPTTLQVRAELPPLTVTADLKFRDFFALPIGPRGLAPSARLLGLAGQRVRIVGYMARQEEPSPGILLLAPLPVALGDEDESFADDLPAATVYVHLADADRDHRTPRMPGLLAVTGVLRLGATAEADGRQSFVRLDLDPALSQSIVAAH